MEIRIKWHTLVQFTKIHFLKFHFKFCILKMQSLKLLCYLKSHYSRSCQKQMIVRYPIKYLLLNTKKTFDRLAISQFYDALMYETTQNFMIILCKIRMI